MTDAKLNDSRTPNARTDIESDADRLLQARLQAVETADSAQSMLDAVEALAELKHQGAIDMLIRVLGYNNPGAAVAAVDGLIQLGTPAASALLSQIDGYNYGARAWALRVLAGIGDPRGLDLILETSAEDFSLSVRRNSARAWRYSVGQNGESRTTKRAG